MQRSKKRKLIKEAIKFNTTSRLRHKAHGERSEHPGVAKDKRNEQRRINHVRKAFSRAGRDGLDSL